MRGHLSMSRQTLRWQVLERLGGRATSAIWIRTRLASSAWAAPSMSPCEALQLHEQRRSVFLAECKADAHRPGMPRGPVRRGFCNGQKHLNQQRASDHHGSHLLRRRLGCCPASRMPWLTCSLSSLSKSSCSQRRAWSSSDCSALESMRIPFKRG